MEKSNIKRLLEFIEKNRELIIMFLTLIKNCKPKKPQS